MDDATSMPSRAASMDNMPSMIGVVTVTYNSALVMPDFIRSLESQLIRNFIVIAVDNASTDDTIAQLASWNFENLVLIKNDQNEGVAAANNRGIRLALAAGCDYVLLLNNDVVFPPELFQELLRGLDANHCQMTVPIIYYYDQPDVIWCAGGRFKPLLGYLSRHIGDGSCGDGQFVEPQKVNYVPTCCVMIRRAVFDRIGLMDERYFVYSDDVDFMYRALLERLSIFMLPKVKLWHKVSSLTGGNESDFALFYGARGRSLFLYKHLGIFFGSIWSFIYLSFYWIRPLLGQDTWHRSSVRRNGIRAGRMIGMKPFEDLRG